MRIISGTYRGKTLLSPDGQDIRPTSDRTKEAVFNILQWGIEDCVFVDLFAGSGSMGIEAVSRGAKTVYFVDSEKYSIDLINANLKGIKGDFYVKQADYKDALRALAHHGVKADYIYADPPYKYVSEHWREILETVYNSGVLDKDGILIIEHGRDLRLGTHKLTLFDERQYGIATVDMYRYKKTALVSGTFDPFTLGHLHVVESALKNADEVQIVIFQNPDKTPTYDLEKRLRLIELACSDLKDKGKIKVSSSDGYVADYCVKNGISVIYRGSRNEKDREFEEKMAEYNLENGGVETVIVDAKDKYISSTEAKQRLMNRLNADKYLDRKIIAELVEEI